MRHLLRYQAPPRRTRKLAVALLSAALLSFPVAASAQGPGPHGPGMQGQGMQGAGMQGRGGPGPGMEGNEPRMSRGTERFIRLYDTNGDGKVSIEEINADQTRMFTALDVDGDKMMSVDEIRRRGRSLLIFRTTTLFDLLDVDGNGKLSLAEVQGPAKRWFKRYDTNGDGVMDAAEIPPQRHFGRGGRR